MARRILVTSALPYANGHIHLGHLVEYIQTDIWVRFQKLSGKQCVFVCADDTHGTAIMIRARQEGRPETELIGDMQAAHVKDFAGFDIVFDHYGSTNSPANRELCAEVWKSLRAAGLVHTREVTQLFDPEAGTFLADRFVKGTCPVCKSPNQYGDSCDKCQSTYSPTELIDPVSTLSGATPELRSADHLFIETERERPFLNEWTQTGDHLHPDVAKWLAAAFLSQPLRDWDVSRPAPYFGFEIPDAPGNYWYVWFDAPIGYMAATKEWADANKQNFNDWWRESQTEIHHFIGKDITYFHTLFWPVMLKAGGFNLPRRVHIHGFLTVNGEKMSKSKGTFVRASTYLESGLDPAYLRYYYASKLTPKLDDLDMNLDEFVNKVNSDLVGKVVNLASRTARFVEATGLSAKYPDDGGLFKEAAAASDEIAAAYEACDYNRAMRAIMLLADRATKFVEEREPWKLAKQADRTADLQDACTVSLNLFRQLVIYLAPVLPRLAEQTGELLNRPIAHWDLSQTPLVGTTVGKFKHLMQRVDAKQIEQMIAASTEAPAAPALTAKPTSQSSKTTGATMTEENAAAQSPTAGDGILPVDGPEPLAAEPMAETITFEEFAKVDLRVARVIAAEEVPKSKKLLRLTLSLGGEERRNVFAGIKEAYKPEALVGRLVIMAANLAPRQMTFGLSEGMVVASGPGGAEVFVLSPDSGAKPGQRIH
jgi:methionyl-tRNA synthetase